ncbi:MAG: hypothetical protein ACFB10_15140 [Salibacteraceae bacterium]
MKKLFFPLFFLLAACSSRPSHEDCKSFHTGEFRYHNVPDSDTRIVRTADRQIETSEKNGFKDEYAVVWANDCRYQLVLLATNRPEGIPIAIGDTISTLITSIDGDSYEFRWNYEQQHYGAQLQKVK